MISPEERRQFHEGVDRALKRAVAKVRRDAARQGIKLAVWQDGKARLVTIPPEEAKGPARRGKKAPKK